jgi:iron complex transport system substrate-binding protein
LSTKIGYPRFPSIAAICLIALTLASGASASRTVAVTARSTTAATTHAATQTIVDQAGRTVTVPTDATRIAVDYPALPATMYMLGAIDDVVATIPSARTDLLQQIDPATAQIPTPFSGTGVNSEALLATNPQIIFVVENLASTVLPTAAQLGIPVVEFANFDGPQQLEQGVSLMAKVLGTPKAQTRAKQYATFYNNIVKEVDAKTRKLAKAQRPSMYYATGAPLTTEGLASSVTVWMNEAGARNVAAAVPPTGGFNFPTVTAEQVLAWNPDYIIASTPAVQQQVLSDPDLATAAAVTGKKVIVAPTGFFGWQVRGPETALMPLWAATVLHPSLFSKVSMEKVALGFYHLFFDVTLSTSQLQSILSGTPQ